MKEMAAENGIPGRVCGALYKWRDSGNVMLTAALGKIDVECRELQPKQIMEDWVEYIKGRCMEQEKIALAVRKKGKTLKGVWLNC